MTDESKTMTDLVERLEDHAIHFDSIQYLAEAADIRAAIATIEAQAREIEHLTFDQCHAGYNDDWGNHRCNYQDQLSTVRRDVLEEAKLRLEGLCLNNKGMPLDGVTLDVAIQTIASGWLQSPVHAGEGPGPSTLAAEPLASPSVSLRGEPAPDRAIAAVTEEEIAIALINETRRQHNLPPVEWADPALNNDKKSWLLRARAVLGVMENHDARAQANQ